MENSGQWGMGGDESTTSYEYPHDIQILARARRAVLCDGC